MQHLKKYNNFLLVIIFGFYSLIIGSDYVPFSPSEVTETSRIIPAIMSENPKMALVISAAALLGSGMLYLGKNKMSNFAEKKCATLVKTIVSEGKKIEDSSIATKCLLYALRPCVSGFKNYVIWPIPVAAITAYIGYLMEHPYLGVGFGTSFATLILGWKWFNQSISELASDIKDLTTKVDNIQTTINEVAQDVKTITEDLPKVEERLRTEIGKAETNITEKLSGTEKRLTNETKELKEVVEKLGKDFKDVAKDTSESRTALMDAKKKLEELGINSNKTLEALQTVNERLKDLEEADYKLITMQEDFNKFSEKVFTIISEVSKKNTNQVNEIIGKLNSQERDLNLVRQQLDTINKTEKENNELIKSLENVCRELCKENRDRLIDLEKKMQNDRSQWKEIALKYEESNTNFILKLSELDSIKTGFTETLERFNAQVKILQEELNKTKESQNNLEKKMDTNHSATLSRFDIQEEYCKTLKMQIKILIQENNQRKKENEELKLLITQYGQQSNQNNTDLKNKMESDKQEIKAEMHIAVQQNNYSSSSTPLALPYVSSEEGSIGMFDQKNNPMSPLSLSRSYSNAFREQRERKLANQVRTNKQLALTSTPNQTQPK